VVERRRSQFQGSGIIFNGAWEKKIPPVLLSSGTMMDRSEGMQESLKQKHEVAKIGLPIGNGLLFDYVFLRNLE
jgi:hypothetical protein